MNADRTVKVLVTQSGNDTRTAVALPLPALDGKSAYSIQGVRCYWYDCNTVAAGDYRLFAIVSTDDAALVPSDDEWIIDVGWACQNTAGVAVAFPVPITIDHFLTIPRLTVQPFIYAMVDSTSTGQANDVYFEVFYSVEKLSELEYLRLLAGGA